MALLDASIIDELRKSVLDLAPESAANLWEVLSKTPLAALAVFGVQLGWHTDDFGKTLSGTSGAAVVHLAFSLIHACPDRMDTLAKAITYNLDALKSRAQSLVPLVKQGPIASSSEKKDVPVVRTVHPVHSTLTDIVSEGKVICLTGGVQSEVDRVVCGLFNAGHAVQPYDHLVIVSSEARRDARGKAYASIEQQVLTRHYQYYSDPAFKHIWPIDGEHKHLFIALDIRQSELKANRQFIRHCKTLNATIVIACCDKMVSTSVLCRSYVDIFGVLRTASIFLDGIPKDAKAISDVRETLVKRDGDCVFVDQHGYEDVDRYRFVSAGAY